MIKLNTINGLIAAIINNAAPIIVILFSLSIIPDISSNTPKKPKTAGIICENISVPVAILSHC